MESILIIIFFFSIATSLGLLFWTSFLNKRVVNFFDLLIGLVIGSFILTWFIFLVSNISGTMNRELNFAILAIVAITTIFKNYRQLLIDLPKASKQNILISFFYSSAFVYFFMVFRKLLFFREGNLFAGWINVWGDWAAHLSYATSFAYGQNFPPELPLFAGKVFSYPFLADFLSGILINLGVNFIYSLIIPSLLFTFISFVFLSYLAFKITGKLVIGILTPLLFFLNGGLGFYYYYINQIDTRELTKIPQENIQWISAISSQFIPQRGFALSFPLALIYLLLLYEIYNGSKDKKIFFLAGLTISLMPLFHFHSFVILIFITLFVFAKTFKYFKNWLFYCSPVALISVYIFSHYFIGNEVDNPIKYHIGWMAKGLSDILPFWIKNFGIMLILPIGGFWVAGRKIKYLSLPFFSIFILANMYIFQPWEWDNTKVFIYWYLGAAILAAIFLEKLLSSKFNLLKLWAILFFAIAIYSGAFDAKNLLNHEQNKLTWFSKEQIEVAEFIKANTPPKSIFLTADNHDNLVPVLTGRRILLGYPGWLWSYGVDYYKRQSDIDLMKNGSDTSKNLLEKYGVDYIIIGPVELSQQFDRVFFDMNFNQVYTRKGYTIHSIN